MVKPAYMACVVALGGALGLGFGWLIWGQAKAADRIVAALLQERCLPYVLGDAPATDGLVKTHMNSATGFAEEDRLIVLRFGENRYGPHCRISDILAPWSEAERNAVLKATREFAIQHVAPLNDGLLVEEDVSLEGLGAPQITWRRPDMETGFFAGFVHTPSQQGFEETSIRVGVSEFIRPAQIREGSDA